MDAMDKNLIDSQKLADSEVVDELLATFRGSENLKRIQAFDALNDERKYQDNLYKDSNQEQINIPGELVLLKVYLDKAFITYADTFGDPGEKPTMDVIRKIGAIALRCMENHGSVKRESKDVEDEGKPELIGIKVSSEGVEDITTKGVCTCSDIFVDSDKKRSGHAGPCRESVADKTENYELPKDEQK